MSRARIRYGALPQVAAFTGHDPDQPVAGFYRTRLRSGGAYVGVRIWFGAPRDPLTGEEMDRGHRWQATVNGSYAELETVWPRCAGEPIDQPEHDHLARLQSWAEQHAPGSGLADPKQRLDPLSTPMMF